MMKRAESFDKELAIERTARTICISRKDWPIKRRKLSLKIQRKEYQERECFSHQGKCQAQGR